MKKPTLVIDKEEWKFFLNGESIGQIINRSFPQDEVIIKIPPYQKNKLSGLKCSDFYLSDVEALWIKLENDFLSDYKWIKKLSVFFDKRKGEYLYFDTNLEYWSSPFSFKTFINILKQNESDLVFKNDLTPTLEQGLVCYNTLDKESNDIVSLFDNLVNTFASNLKTTFLKLSQENNYNQQNLTNTFTFPPEIQNSCEQYLIYFATFLKDIGINAETNIESKTHETLFTVIPENGEEALDKIKEALQVYLSLPESPEFENVASEFTDVGVHQLVSQVHFLRSQLALGKSMLQLKDATIKSLELTNYQQNVIIDSHQTKKENEEVIANGLVKVNEVKVKGFTFDLPEILRRIKRRF